MAYRKVVTDAQERVFENELLAALRRDPDHLFSFDGKLKVYSTRYDCLLEGNNVHWDEEKKDIVFVGLCRKGRQPIVDMSKGYAILKGEISLPFREVFEDMRKMPDVSEAYLLSKVRKAVIDKYIASPMQMADKVFLTRSGAFAFDTVPGSKMMVDGGAVQLASCSVDGEGRFGLKAADGMPVSVGKLSLTDIQRIGERILEAHGLVRRAFRDYVDGAALPGNQTESDIDLRAAEQKGLVAVYEKGYPHGVLNAVAKTMSRSYGDVFDPALHDAKSISDMLDRYRRSDAPYGHKPFGFEGREKKKTTNVKLV